MIEPMQPDLAEAVRPQSAAEQLAARVAGHALAQSAVWCTLHIGGSNLKSRTTCDSTLLRRPRTSRCSRVGKHAGYTQMPATSGKRKPFGAVTSIRSHDYQGNARTHATGGGFPDARLLLPAGRVHPVCIAQEMCSWHARRLAQIGRQRPL